MTSQPVALLLATLGVVPSHSRPHVSDDNPFSEAQFKTLKYRPDFPGRFGAYEDAETFCRGFFPWYNLEHRHGALGLMTPHDIHYGLAVGQRPSRLSGDDPKGQGGGRRIYPDLSRRKCRASQSDTAG